MSIEGFYLPLCGEKDIGLVTPLETFNFERTVTRVRLLVIDSHATNSAGQNL